MPTATQDPDLKFLKALDKKVRHYEKCTSTRRGYPEVVDVEEFDDTKLTKSELERLLKIVRERKLILTPMNCNMGFSVGFEVFQGIENAPGLRDTESVLRFREKQLPAGYTFATLARTFMADDNRQRADYFGLETILNDRDRYDY
ncbi:hypothetical protein HY493_01425 [Candidatus Woesearchaeota archaeon]|nr:hypothetical protein [Candidatus Woesearchaeota archaeon]